MDMKTYLKQATPEEREELAQKVRSSVGYFYLIGGGHRKPSNKLCKSLVDAEPKFTLHELRPDIWEEEQEPRDRRHDDLPPLGPNHDADEPPTPKSLTIPDKP